MTERTILRMGNPALRRVAQPVVDPTAPEIAALGRDMEDTLTPINSCGIAAPQIGVDQRV
ncbi:MAG: peptide deformylase, partial [Alphaproteobacteria bacterium]|nr:peptide deformylase [Alphaproteobacteria bacterium]